MAAVKKPIPSKKKIVIAKKKAAQKPIPSKKNGRPTKYKQIFNTQAEKLCKLGSTDKELADFFEVNEDTIHEWKKVYPSFSESIRKGKILADANVADALYHRAIGYVHPDVDIKVIKNKIVTTKLTKHYPPDTAAAIIWLKNRKKETWRDKQEIGVTDNKGKDVKQFFIIGGKRIEF